ncbi:hypothetical protein EMCRGX_G004935 [Ephydatia muelleri]
MLLETNQKLKGKMKAVCSKPGSGHGSHAGGWWQWPVWQRSGGGGTGANTVAMLLLLAVWAALLLLLLVVVGAALLLLAADGWKS